MITRLLLAALLASVAHLRADVRLPAIFGDHMVLQQDHKIPVWGTASPGERVTVTLGPRTAATAADASGRWRVDLDPVLTVSTPATLTVAGKNTLVFKDVLVGDVWLASGQSNMEARLAGTHADAADRPLADHPQIRFFQIPRTNRLEPQSDINDAKWVVCTPQTAAGFSAIGYYFAREISRTQKRPVGIIGSYWGGTPVKAWVSLDALKQTPACTGQLAEFDRQHDYWIKNKDTYPKALADYEAAKKTWQEASAKAKAAGQPAPPAPRGPNNPLGGPGTPGSLYNGMIAPLIPYGLKGVLWYQGESDASNPSSGLAYENLFTRLITDWRTRWGQGDLPFLFVHLAGHLPNRDKTPGVNWAWLRESQRRALALPATRLASAVDLGDAADIHPKNKKDVGLRLALAARALAYGEPIVGSGPLYSAHRVEGRAIRIQFTDTGSGLVIANPAWFPANVTPPPVPAALPGFEIAGADKRWHPAEARIEGTTVVVSSPAVSSPVAVRYGWQDMPEIRLYNREGLPAVPFRTDDWAP